MKTSEGISFSIAHLSRLKQLRCKPGQKLPWFVDEKPPKRTNLPILVAPHWKHGLRKTRCSCDHVSFLLDPDWFWEDPGDFVTPWSDKDSLLNHHLTSFSHVFSDQIFKSFFFNQPIFFVLTVQLRSEHLKANVFVMLFTWVWLKRYSLKPFLWLTVYSFRSFNCHFN